MKSRQNKYQIEKSQFELFIDKKKSARCTGHSMKTVRLSKFNVQIMIFIFRGFCCDNDSTQLDSPGATSH